MSGKQEEDQIRDKEQRPQDTMVDQTAGEKNVQDTFRRESYQYQNDFLADIPEYEAIPVRNMDSDDDLFGYDSPRQNADNMGGDLFTREQRQGSADHHSIVLRENNQVQEPNEKA